MTLEIQSLSRTQMIDITSELNNLISDCGNQEGLCHVFVPHTTAGIALNEVCDPNVALDLEDFLERLIPKEGGYRHLEGNSDAHIKACLLDNSCSVPFTGGALSLGTWQGVFLCEFDGPRRRAVRVTLIPT